MSNISGGGGNTVISVAAGDNLTVDSFGGFGTGDTASNPGELDTLKFTGAGMTAANLLLTQSGSDVLVTFDGVANTQVTLTNTSIDDLENIAGQGNFMFFGQNAVTESLEVIDAQHNNKNNNNKNTNTGFQALKNKNTNKHNKIEETDALTASGGGGGDDRLFG